MSYPIEYGLDKVNDLYEIQGFELDGWCPEVVTANQRACEVQVRDWVESQGAVITRWLGKNKLSYNYGIKAYL